MEAAGMIYPHTVEIVSIGEGTFDAYGQPTEAEESRTNSPAYVQAPVPGDPALMGRDANLEEWVVFLPPAAVIDRNDKIEWGDKVFEVMGLPEPQYTPRGVNHFEVKLRYVEVPA